MGSALTKMRGSLVTRPMQRYNIESRTEKLMEKDKAINECTEGHCANITIVLICILSGDTTACAEIQE